MTEPAFRVRVRVAVAPPIPDFPEEDDALGRNLMERLCTHLQRGAPAPAAILLRRDSVQVVNILPILRHGGDSHRLLAALCGHPDIEAMAIVGIMTRGRRGHPTAARLAGVFIEWADGRWWGSWRPVDDRLRLVPTDTDEVQRAVDGLSRPAGLGNWFRRARFEGLRAEIRPDPPELVN